jgi:hypothetical protein
LWSCTLARWACVTVIEAIDSTTLVTLFSSEGNGREERRKGVGIMKHAHWTVGVVGFALSFWAAAANAEQHLVPSKAMARALVAADNERSADLAAVDRVLRTPAARTAATQAGIDVARLRQALPTLESAELRDLATRAQALEQNPVAGVTDDVNQLLVIFLIVAIVILVLKAVD